MNYYFCDNIKVYNLDFLILIANMYRGLWGHKMQLTLKQQEKAAKEFAKKWENIGDEKQDTQRFWMELLQNVYGINNPADFICFEQRVQLGHTSYIDAMIPATHTMIEQKSLGKDLNAPIRQSDGTLLTPAEQAKRYAAALPYSERPRWIVSCNFKEFHVLDMERPNDSAEIIELHKLGTEFYRLNFLVDVKSSHIEREMEISKGAGELVAQLYDSLLEQYKINPLLTEEDILHNINKLCVRLVFCLYAEDSGLFGKKSLFHDYLQDFQPHQVRNALMDLFRILDTEEAHRSPYESETLLEFPYVNGSLFSDPIEIPQFSEGAVNLILEDACNFDWSEISPTIFGAIFESTLNPEKRRQGGMHYTSIENIHKLIDPLFLDEFRNDFKEAMSRKDGKKKIQLLKALQDKMASKTFLDPAAGSGNFLTEAYLSLRRLENDILRETITDSSGTGILGFDEEEFSPIKVSIQQFYGIEINDFAVAVAKTAIWIAEAQMFKETESIIHKEMDFLPLHNNANIHEGNSLNMDWEEIIKSNTLSYIMGNPPFVGAKKMNKQQKSEVLALFNKNSSAKSLDYVAAWYKKAVEYMKGTKIHAAFVSTNSITQGEQVPILWEGLIKEGIVINFAYKSFLWDSEANLKAHVHCIIIGFSYEELKNKLLYSDQSCKPCYHINAYLAELPDIFVKRRTRPLCNVPELTLGNKTYDDGNLILSEEEKDEVITKEPIIKSWIRPFLGAYEFINRKLRYVIWLKDISPVEINKSKIVKERINNVYNFRKKSSDAGTRKGAEYPSLLLNITQKDIDYSNFIFVPRVSSERRRYIPMGFLPSTVMISDAGYFMPYADLYTFGVLNSNVHMAWMRTVAGRLEMRYRYSNFIVYNNFPWPKLNEKLNKKIEQTAQAILDARELYPDCSLADLYDAVLMPKELREAHRANDRAVMKAYGFDISMTEEDCVTELLKLYSDLCNNN